MASLATIVPTTELEAVNTLLSAINEAPITDVDTATDGDVVVAVDTLRAIIVEVLTRGWRFNTDFEFRVAVNTLKFAIPAGLLKFEVTDRSDQIGYVGRKQDDGTFATDPVHLDLVQRDDAGTLRFYDRVRNTFEFGSDDARPQIFIDAVWGADFVACPETVRRYIVAYATTRFIEDRFGEASVSKAKRDDEAKAFTTLMQDQGDDRTFSLLDNQMAVKFLGRRPRYM
jgi:hypothetical protein